MPPELGLKSIKINTLDAIAPCGLTQCMSICYLICYMKVWPLAVEKKKIKFVYQSYVLMYIQWKKVAGSWGKSPSTCTSWSWLVNLLSKSTCLESWLKKVLFKVTSWCLCWIVSAIWKWLAPIWLDSSVGRALHQYRRDHGFESCSGLNFFKLYFHITVCIRLMINHVSITTALQNKWLILFSVLFLF